MYLLLGGYAGIDEFKSGTKLSVSDMDCVVTVPVNVIVKSAPATTAVTTVIIVFVDAPSQN